MARFSTKHEDREQTFKIQSFNDGLNQDVSPSFLPVTSLTRCKNMKYIINKSLDGTSRVILKQRQGTEAISSAALTDAADVMACTYYVTQAKYILATSSKLYYLNGTTFAPVEIGSISGIPTFTEFNGKLMIHDGGNLKSWDGTTFATVNNLVVDEVIGTGNNTTVDFSGVLGHIPVEAGTLTITYTDTTTKTITVSAGGVFSGDFDAGGTNTFTAATGVYSFRCSGAPDSSTSIYADYEQVDKAPKSKAGIMRASRLYMWGDPDNPSRLWYSGTNDEEAWADATGGYLDVDKNDGYSLTGCLDFFQSLVLIKENSLHRLDNFPGDTTFRVEPLMPDLGNVAYLTAMNDGDLISFLSSEGYVGMSSTQRYGDIQKTADLSQNFRKTAMRFANSSAYADYNQMDKQLWLTLYDDVASAYLPYIYVINLASGGQVSLYQFAFGHSCYKFVNGEMLIGGTDGNLYRLLKPQERCRDNGVSYAIDTFVRGVFANWELPSNRKHNKRLYVHIYGKAGFSATLNLYKDGDYSVPFSTSTVTAGFGDVLIYDLAGVNVADLAGIPIGTTRTETIKNKFNYHDVMFELTSITGGTDAELYGIDFTSAVIGD